MILARGQPLPYSLEAKAGPSVSLTVRQPTPPDLDVDPALGKPPLAGSIVAHRRGHHVLAPVAVRSVGPLGLGAVHRSIGDEAGITVYPDVITARRIASAVGEGRFSEEGSRRGPSIGIGTEFDSIRDYVPDDDIRQVNWRASLRVGRPMSNQYRIDQDRDVICLVDAGRLMAAPLGEMTRLDAAVDAVAAIAYTADKLGDRAGVVAFDRTVLRNLPPRRRGGEAVVQAVHDLEPSGLESDYETAFRVVAKTKRALVLFFTDLLEESAAAPLVDAIPVLARKHQVAVAGSADDELAAAVATAPRAPSDVYRAAAALSALDDRERVTRILAHASVEVIEAGRGLLPERCVAAYLDVKARARL